METPTAFRFVSWLPAGVFCSTAAPVVPAIQAIATFLTSFPDRRIPGFVTGYVRRFWQVCIPIQTSFCPAPDLFSCCPKISIYLCFLLTLDRQGMVYPLICVFLLSFLSGKPVSYRGRAGLRSNEICSSGIHRHHRAFGYSHTAKLAAKGVCEAPMRKSRSTGSDFQGEAVLQARLNTQAHRRAPPVFDPQHLSLCSTIYSC